MSPVNALQPRATPAWRGSLPLWIVIIGGLGLSLSAFLLARQQEIWRAEAEFGRRAEIHQQALHSSLQQRLENLRSLQKLMQLSSNVTQSTFREWSRDAVLQHPEIQQVDWCPRVLRSERAGYEAAARRNGFEHFAFFEIDPSGAPVPVPDRAEYFPVFYVEPLVGNEAMAGFDAGTGGAAVELDRARDSGQPAASSRVRIGMNGADADPFGLVIIFPVYESHVPLDTVQQRRDAFRGCIRGVFRIGDLLEAAWNSVPFVGVETLIVDPAALNPANRFILFHSTEISGTGGLRPSETEFRSAWHYESSLRVGARTWTILFRPSQRWRELQSSWLPYFILVGGLAATLFVGAYVRSSSKRAEVIERTVAERTAALSHEIAERRRTEEELRKTESILVRAQRIGRVGSWEADLVRRTLVWSEETYRIFGQEPAGFVPTSEAFFACVHPHDRQRVEDAVRTAIAQGRRYDVEHRVRRPDGSECFVHEMAEIVRDEQGHATRLIGTVQDITERRYAEERLHWERNLLRTLIDNVPDYIFFKDQDGQFIMSNVAAQRMLGAHNVEEIIGKTDADLLPAEVAMVYAATDANILKTGEPLVNHEEPFVTRSGEKRYLLTTRIPLKDGQGKVTGIVGIARDITERKRAEDERNVMERKFQETQKLESLGVLAGGIAHDFNNLLTGILGNASLARMELAPESPLHSHLQQIEVSSQRAAELCRQMLAYSGKGRFVIQRIDLSALVSETLHLLQVSISKKATLKLDLADDLPGIMADATQIRQIIMNLVINASDAIGDNNGLITISTKSIYADYKYLDDLVGTPELPSGNYVVLEVTDNGCGMTPQTKAKIFEPFFTTKFTGRGLGLAAVLGIVRGHKGALKVYSEPGRGSTFRLLLPGAGAASGDTKVEQRSPSEWRGKGTVLVIDDEDSVRMVAGRMLRTLGFEILAAPNGDQGLKMFRERGREISAVLLDLTMPGMDGEETFRNLRLIRPDACVILMSGFNEQEAAARFVGKGLAGFLQKPFTPDELRQRLAAFGNRAVAA